MAIKIWTTDIQKCFIWTTPVKSIWSWDTQVRPSGWQPWANTLIYYPLTSDLVDQMWNWNTWTMHWTCTFDSATGIHVTWKSGNYVTWMSNGIANKNIFTINVRWKAITNRMVLIWYASNSQTTQAFCVYKWDGLEIWCITQWWNQSDTTWKISTDNNWHNYCITANWSKYDTYIDWVLLKEHFSSSPLNNISEMQLWWWGIYWNDRSWEWYIKDYIVETVAWSAGGILAYYNQTKSNYWL